MTPDTADTTENTTVTPEAPPAQPVSLQLADLILMLKVIQITAQRGAIRAEL